MKKLLSVILVTLMLFAVMAPAASAVVGYEAVPIIYIRGNGEEIYDENGNLLASDLGGLLGDDEEEDEDSLSKDDIIEACVNILTPFVTEGLIFDKWDSYGKAIYDELSPLFATSALDGNGDPQYGTAVSEQKLQESEYLSTQNLSAGGYGLYEYSFVYDWRLSPYDHVDRLHQYIQNIKKATGSKEVCIFVRCFGGGLAMAYLERYGDTGIKNVFFNDVLSNGTSLISDGFSGKVDFDGKNVQRYLKQLERCAELEMGTGIAFAELIDEIITKTLDPFTQVGATDAIFGGVEDLYAKLYKALIPAVCLATGIATQPNYWTCVEEEDFDAAMNLIFGEEGSEARVYYAGLIKKIEYYREHVTAVSDELLKKCAEEYGIHFGVGSKYGYVDMPIIESANEYGDALVSVKDSSFGATCALVGKTLADDYIEARIAENKAEYISPDKVVDASTGLFPETTWYIKNAHHDFNNLSDIIAHEFLCGTGVNVNNATYGRFNIADEYSKTWAPMTEENCADFDWIGTPVEEPTEETIAISFIRWLTVIFRLIAGLFNGEIKFESIDDFILSAGM